MNEFPETREMVRRRVVRALIEVEMAAIAEKYTFKPQVSRTIENPVTAPSDPRIEDWSWPSM